MQITVSNYIIIDDYTRELIDWCRNNLVLDNPEYHKKQRMGLWLGNTPSHISLYAVDGGRLYLPFGCLDYMWQTYGKTCSFERQIADLRHVNYQSNVNLYDYQEEAVNKALRAKNGVIVMPCGAGKTQTALELIARIGGKALWLTHTQDLLNQSMNRAKSVYDAPKEIYGTITGGKVNIGTGITFATVQTMSKLDLAHYRDTWDIVIVDECHKAVGSPTKVMQFYKVLSNLSCRYKYGLTATPKRSDGLEKSMFALLGDIVHQVDKKAVANTTCPVKVETIETGYVPDYDCVLMGDGTINYAKLVDDLVQNEDRYKFVFDAIEDTIGINGGTLVLANRVNYIQRMNDDFNKYVGKSVCLSTLGNSKKAKAIRKEALRKLNDGEIDCIFATYQLAKEGLDVPNLRYVVFATPEKDPTTIEQATGRVGRKADGKPYGTVIDFVDEFGMYKGWWKKRETVYKKLGYDIIK
jgi:superfamily II DNA or RNA helicase